MAELAHRLGRAAREVATSPVKQPLRAVKWGAPLLWCATAWCFQSVMLHQATVRYVLRNDKNVLPDVGHDFLGNKVVPLKVLDMISCFAMAFFFAGAALMRDLRLWCKVFMCCGFLFFLKGLFDCITNLPDSSGWATCEQRLGASGVTYFKGFKGVHGAEYWFRLLRMELYGVAGHWPVRYCSDMILSGHTFVMFLFLLGSADLTRKLRLVIGGAHMRVAEVFLNVLVLVCAGADLYLIVVNHFHYTVDVVLAIVMTLLLYTNAGITILTDWWVEWLEKEGNKRRTDDNGAVWIPPLLLPCCCFQGFYSVSRLKSKHVKQRMENNMGLLCSGPEESPSDSDEDDSTSDDEHDEFDMSSSAGSPNNAVAKRV